MSETKNYSGEEQKIPFGIKVAYGCGLGGGNILATLMSTYLTIYYTNTAMIGALAIATMMVVCRVFDGISDFCMGTIVDRTHTKIGKARPWLFVAAPLMCIGTILVLNVPNGFDEGMKLVYAYITYVLLSAVIYTIFGIAHAALLARMTRNAEDRNTTSVVAQFLQAAVGLVAGGIISYLYLNFGWRTTSILLGLAEAVMILITAVFVKENVGMDQMEAEMRESRKKKNAAKKNEIPLGRQLKIVLTNRYFWLALLIGAATLLMNANAMSSMAYYCSIVMGEEGFMATLMSLGQFPGLVVLLIMPYLANKYSKRNFMMAGCALLIIGFVVMAFAGSNHVMLIIGTMCRATGAGPIFAGTFAFVADAADYGEWKSGVRCEGLFSSSQSIGQKIGIGLGSTITLFVLGFFGYDAAAEVQPDSVINGIKFVFSYLGIILSVILFIAVALMDVEKYLPQIRADFEAKKAKQD